jgi:hypothetical protein
VSWGLVTAIVGYAVLRAVAAIGAPPMDEAAIAAPSAHVPFFWRMLEAGYAGGLGAFAAALIARRGIRAPVAALAPALVVAACLLVVQTLVWP